MKDLNISGEGIKSEIDFVKKIKNIFGKNLQNLSLPATEGKGVKT
jgi:hypothetical protein